MDRELELDLTPPIEAACWADPVRELVETMRSSARSELFRSQARDVIDRVVNELPVEARDFAGTNEAAANDFLDVGRCRSRGRPPKGSRRAMRLRRLDLTRHGKFTDKSIDFGSTPSDGPDLHIVFGLNEAGKSTALSGFLDLLFGIEERSRYNFLHEYGSMRVGGVLQFTARNMHLRGPSSAPTRCWTRAVGRLGSW